MNATDNRRALSVGSALKPVKTGVKALRAVAILGGGTEPRGRVDAKQFQCLAGPRAVNFVGADVRSEKH